MRPSKARFISACQQLLVLGAVFAVLAPAANVVSLEVITALPRESAPSGQPEVPLPAQSLPERVGADAGTPTARAEASAVEPQVEEHPMELEGAPEAPMLREHTPQRDRGADERRDRPGTSPTSRTVSSEPQEVSGYGAVGVTWDTDAGVGDDEIRVEVRTSTDGSWSQWQRVDFHAEHGPDPGAVESQEVRAGTDALVIGDVDEVQARATTAPGTPAPRDLRLAVVAPGESRGGAVEEPAIDTGADTADGSGTVPSDEGDLALQATTVTTKPKIFSRAQWGADERLRSGRPSYGEVHAGFVHHTVNANGYTKAQVPGILRSIYAYHTRSRGWSDIGYNFLVDRFGRIWEGRYGGVDRAVVGAHTLGYNENSFAMSAIGNFDTAKPGAKVVRAYGRLMAWKLSLHGVAAGSTRQRVSGRTFPAINGHRDAGSTACPGRHLYAKLGTIRQRAAGLQQGWEGRDRVTDVVGSTHPDLLLRRKDGAVVALPTGGMLNWKAGRNRPGLAGGHRTVVASPDLTGDRRADLVVVAADGAVAVLPGTEEGFARPVPSDRRLGRYDHLTAVGDLDRDGRNDLVGRNAKGKLAFLRGNGKGRFAKPTSLGDWSGYDRIAATGDVTGDGVPDVLGRDRSGRLWVHPGTGSRKLGARQRVNGNWGSYDVITGFGDMDGDGRADLLLREEQTQRTWMRAGKGNGRFRRALGPMRRLERATSVSAVALAGGAGPDIIAIAPNGDARVWAHRGTRHTGKPVALGRGFRGTELLLNVGDWDRDGHNDVVTRNGNGVLRLHRGLGKGRFAERTRLAKGFGDVAVLAAVGDVTGDGHPDLMGRPKGGAMHIYPGHTTGLRAGYAARNAVRGSAQFGLGRWDADGAPDVLMRTGSTLAWYRGNGPGGLTGAPTTLPTSLARFDLVASPGDVTGDGRPDLVVRRSGTGAMWVLPGGSRNFGKPKLLATGMKGYDRIG